MELHVHHCWTTKVQPTMYENTKEKINEKIQYIYKYLKNIHVLYIYIYMYMYIHISMYVYMYVQCTFIIV